MKGMRMCRILLVSLAGMAMLVGQLAMAATNHTVGGPNGGWDQSTDLQTWASSQTFLVGDNLVFQYTPSHDVLEVSQADFDSCVTSNPIGSYSGGLTVISLDSQGKRHFICGTGGHCVGGMKVEIDAVAATTPTRPPVTPAAPPPAVASSPPPAAAANPVSPPGSSKAPAPSPKKQSRSPSPKASPSTKTSPSPAFSPKSSPPPLTGSLPANPPASSATKTYVIAGFGLVMMMLLNI